MTCTLSLISAQTGACFTFVNFIVLIVIIIIIIIIITIIISLIILAIIIIIIIIVPKVFSYMYNAGDMQLSLYGRPICRALSEKFFLI